MNTKEWLLCWAGGTPLLIHVDTLTDDQVFGNLIARLYHTGITLVQV